MRLHLALFVFICFYFISLNLCSNRIPINKRKFVSEAVDNYINQTKPKFINSDLAQLYENCFPNTLDTTVEHDEKLKDTFIITGDIDAMWMRDSSFQLLPYVEFANQDSHLKSMLMDAVKRQVKSILIDPYANAFNKNSRKSPFESDETYKKVNGEIVSAMNDNIWERKYELDSMISVLFYHINLYNNTKDYSFINNDYLSMLELIAKTIKEQSIGTDEEDEHGGWNYFFMRNCKEALDTQHQGRGNPVATCGLIRSSFRASDDATLLGFNIPENTFMVATLTNLSGLFDDLIKNSSGKSDIDYDRLARINNILKNITKRTRDAIFEHGVIKPHADPSTYYFAYEVDCYGNSYFMDDSNYPSLMSLPFFNFVDQTKDNELYNIWLNTKKRILSKKFNPYFFESKKNSYKDIINLKDKIFFSGVGSPHTERGSIWPLGIIMRGLTSTDKDEILECITMLVESAKSTGFMHESFKVDNPEDYTRSWFAWANSFFGFFINHVIKTNPDLILK